MPQTSVDVYDSVKGAWKKRVTTGDSRFWTGTSWLPSTAPAEPDPGTGTPTTPTTPTDPVPSTAFTDLPGLVAFMDAATPGATYADGAEVGSWRANGGDQVFTQAAATTLPTYRAATANDPAHVRFDGANDRLVYSGNLLPTSGSFTLYAVVRLQQLGYGAIFNQASATALNPTVTLDVANNGSLRALRRTDDGALTQSPGLYQLSNVWRVVTVVSSDYAALTVRSNEKASLPGSASSTSATGEATTTTTTLGMRLSETSDTVGKFDVPFLGDIAAVVTYQGAHDAARITSIEQQLATRYGVTNVLPSKGGTVDGPSARRTASRLERSVAYGIPATNRVTGRALPNFATTGVQAGIVPVPQPAGFTSSADNQLVENKWFIGPVKINHSGVTFKNCVVYNTTDPKIDARGVPAGGTRFKLVNCEVYGKQDDGGTGIGYGRYEAVDCFFHDCEDEFRLGIDVQITRCLATSHSNGYLTSSERLHTDCVQSNGASNNDTQRTTVTDSTLIAIRRNLTKGNSAVIIASEGASIDGVNQGSPVRHITVDGCYMANGSYSLYFKTPGESGSPGPFEDLVVTNNVFRTEKDANGAFTANTDAQYGAVIAPHADLTAEYLTFTGNVMENGSAVTISRWTKPTVNAPTALAASMDPATRVVTATWKLPAIGPLTLAYSDSTGASRTTTVAGLKSKYVFETPASAGATSFTITATTSAGSVSVTVNP